MFIDIGKDLSTPAFLQYIGLADLSDDVKEQILTIVKDNIDKQRLRELMDDVIMGPFSLERKYANQVKKSTKKALDRLREQGYEYLYFGIVNVKAPRYLARYKWELSPEIFERGASTTLENYVQILDLMQKADYVPGPWSKDHFDNILHDVKTKSSMPFAIPD